MIRFTDIKAVQGSAANNNAVYFKSGFCLSTDTKHTDDDLATGSCLVEVDTGDAYFYDEVAKTWAKV